MVNGRCVLGRKTKWGIIEGQFRDPREGSGENRSKSEAQPLALAILTPTRESGGGLSPEPENSQTWGQVPLCFWVAPGKLPTSFTFLTNGYHEVISLIGWVEGAEPPLCIETWHPGGTLFIHQNLLWAYYVPGALCAAPERIQ